MVRRVCFTDKKTTSTRLVYFATHLTTITGVRSNQDLIWNVKIGLYMGFNVYGLSLIHI